MLRKILAYGFVAGLLVGFVLFGMAVTRTMVHGPAGMAIGYLTMLIALSAIFVAVKRHRDVDLGGVIRFWPAFGLGLGITVVAGFIYVLAWEAALAVNGGPDAFVQLMIDQQRAEGGSAADLSTMEAFRPMYANPLFRLPITFSEIFPVGLLISIVAAVLLRNPRFLPLRRKADEGQEAARASA